MPRRQSSQVVIPSADQKSGRVPQALKLPDSAIGKRYSRVEGPTRVNQEDLQSFGGREVPYCALAAIRLLPRCGLCYEENPCPHFLK